MISSPKVTFSNLKGNVFSKFKLKKKLQINPGTKYLQKSDKNHDHLNFTPKNRDGKKNTSLDYKTNPKKINKQKFKKQDKKLFSGGMKSKISMKKNISNLLKKKSNFYN